MLMLYKIINDSVAMACNLGDSACVFLFAILFVLFSGQDL